MSADFTPEKEDYKILTPFKMQVLTNFPYIEADFDALTNYQLLCKVVEYLNNVITNENEVTEQITSLYNAYVSLQNYVNTEIGNFETTVNNRVDGLESYMNNYFNNLDVQQEINNKLDAMTLDGTLTNLIKNYVDPIYQAYEDEINGSISDMQEDITTIGNRVNSIASGTPRGVYATVAALTSADPNHNYIYVVTEDGKWYYYNTSTTSWTAGGTYQSAGIANNSVGYSELAGDIKDELMPLSLIKPEYTIDDTIYTGSVDSTISTQAASGWKSGSIDVNITDTIIIPAYPNTAQTTQNLLFLVDDNDTIIEAYKQTDMVASVYTNKTPLIINIPNNVVKIYYNLPAEQSNIQTEWNPFIIKSYNYNDNRITAFLGNKLALTPSQILDNTIYNVYYWNYTLNSYKTNIYNVTPLEKINVVSKLPKNANFPAGLFLDSENSIVGIIGIYGESSSYKNVDVDVIVPANASKLLISYYQYEAAPVVSYYSLVDVITPQPKLNVSYVDGVLTMTNLINNTSIEMKNHGGNNLFMISKYTVNGTTKNIGTDMIPAPYIVYAKNNANGDRTNEGFTGGNHQWNNQASGSTPTATQQSLYIYADNNLLSSNVSNVLCNEVHIIETNRVQATNTCLQAGGGRNVLEEKIIYNFDGTSLKVKNIITPLEEINIKIYYGIQTSGFTNVEYKVFSNKIYDVDSLNSIPSKPDAIYGSSLICAKLSNSGLGNYHYNHGNKALISNNKSYYTPILFNSETFTTADVNYIEGEYIFNSHQL